MAEPDLLDLYYNTSDTDKDTTTVEENKEEDILDLFYSSPETEEKELVEEEDVLDTYYGESEVQSKAPEDTRTAYEQVEASEKGIKTLEEFANDSKFIADVNAYGKARYGDDGIQQEGESNEDYVQRFLTHTRQLESNSLDLGSQVAWMRGASEEDKAKFGRVCCKRLWLICLN